MMKHLFFAVVFVLSGMLASAAVITEDMMKNNLQNVTHKLADLTAEESRTELDAIKAQVKTSGNVRLQAWYCLADVATFGKEKPEATWNVMFDRLKSQWTEMGITEKVRTTDSVCIKSPVSMVLRWHAGKVDETRMEAGIAYGKAQYEAGAKTISFELAQLMRIAGKPYAEYSPYYLETEGGRNRCMELLLNSNSKEIKAGAGLFWEIALQGKLQPEQAMDCFTKIMAYELEQENFDAAGLRVKLVRLNSIYNTKAHAVSNSGGSNPWSSFLGAIRDNIEILNALK